MRSKIAILCFLLTMSQAQAGPVSTGGNGWVFSSLESPRAYLHTEHSMSWVEAEDFCQMIYGHLATDDSAEYLKEYLKLKAISGAVWIGLHQSKPQTQFTWTNDFDWSEVSLSPGDGWGEYVEEYESSLCVSLDIDHGFRWDTRYCQGVMVSGAVCQIELPLWLKDGRCNPVIDSENVTYRYYPDQEMVFWTEDGDQEHKLCSIEDDKTEYSELNQLPEYQFSTPSEGSGEDSESFVLNNQKINNLQEGSSHLYNSETSAKSAEEEEGAISISIKYEIRNPNSKLGPIIFKDEVSENYFGINMNDSESNLEVASNIETNLRDREKENESNRTIIASANTTIYSSGDKTKYSNSSENTNLHKLLELNVSKEENISEKEENIIEDNFTPPLLLSSPHAPEDPPTAAYKNTQETLDSKYITDIFLADNVTIGTTSTPSQSGNSVPGITSTGETANLTAPTSDEVVTSNTETGLNGEEEEPHPILVSGNAASSSFVNSPILHRQKRLSPYRNGRTFPQYNSRNRVHPSRSYHESPKIVHKET